MRKAKNIIAQTVEADCWKCGEPLTDGCESYCLAPAMGDFEFRCTNCGTVNALGKWAEIELPVKEI